MDIASKLLDSDDDGNVMDDLGGLLGSFMRKLRMAVKFAIMKDGSQ